MAAAIQIPPTLRIAGPITGTSPPGPAGRATRRFPVSAKLTGPRCEQTITPEGTTIIRTVPYSVGDAHRSPTKTDLGGGIASVDHGQRSLVELNESAHDKRPKRRPRDA